MIQLTNGVMRFYEVLSKKVPFTTLDKDLREIAVKVKRERETGWDFVLYKYILDKSFIGIVQNSISVCHVDSGDIDYIVMVTKNKDEFLKAVSMIDSSPLFQFAKENKRQRVYHTPTPGIFIQVEQHPNSINEFAISILHAELTKD